MKKFIVFLLCFFMVAGSVEARRPKKEKSFVKININKADAKELAKIPGISKSKAKRIVEGRPYKSVEDLKKITHYTKSGREVYDFATKKGRWKKSMRILIEKEVFTTKGGRDFVDQIALYRYLYPEPVDINTATLEELKALPGISKTKAKRIIEGRPYRTIEDLKKITHITKSGREVYDFATSKGRWKKAIKPLIESGRLICKKTKGVKKKKKEEEESDWEDFEDYE